MGNKYVVQGFLYDTDKNFGGWHDCHRGQWVVPALWMLWAARRSKLWGCVKLEIR